ncbi:hypothetical protein D7V94_01830 [Parablautia intestinalis]|uniref:Uncharacterized protein n=1 Tax=Parablautia intestinalis TaxID=2320100 RepID=A0A3A9ASC9_9FIRM|nr:hypothetical protein [Parablautia intestinalis]RKI94307.1 hypothetical protein D7V94_01830 [Parablautia intestinalis]
MNYRQWKKKYKLLHGLNPPLQLDKRRQRRIAKKEIKTVSHVDFATAVARVSEVIINAFASVVREVGRNFDLAGTMCRNVAENIQPLEVKGRIPSWKVREYGSSHYAVYEINALGGADEIRAITYSRQSAGKIAEIMEDDYIEYIRRTSPGRIKCHNNIAENLRVAVITAYESGVIKGI